MDNEALKTRVDELEKQLGYIMHFLSNFPKTVGDIKDWRKIHDR